MKTNIYDLVSPDECRHAVAVNLIHKTSVILGFAFAMQHLIITQGLALAVFLLAAFACYSVIICCFVTLAKTISGKFGIGVPADMAVLAVLASFGVRVWTLYLLAIHYVTHYYEFFYFRSLRRKYS